MSSRGKKKATCAVCATGPRKYKCPKCTAPYCSAACFSTHKTTCVPTVTAPAPPPAATAAPVTCVVDDDPDFMTLPDEAIMKITTNEKLLNMLRDRRLQDVIRAIDGAPDRRRALEQARGRWGADFQAFLDEMLVTVGVCTRRPDGTVEFVG